MRRLFLSILILLSLSNSTYAETSPGNAQNKTKERDLTEMRKDIDKLDEMLIALMADRMAVCREVGQYKQEHNIQVVQGDRYNEIVKKLCKAGAKYGLSETFVKALFEAIHTESVRQQEELKNNH